MPHYKQSQKFQRSSIYCYPSFHSEDKYCFIDRKAIWSNALLCQLLCEQEGMKPK